MRVTMMTTVCGPEGNAYPGTVLELDNDTAKQWIENNYARPYDKERDAKLKQIGLDKAKPAQ